MKIFLHALGAGALLATLAGCLASAPLSFVSGMPVTRTDPNLYPVRIASVDGKPQTGDAAADIQIEPGARWLTLDAGPPGSRHTGQQRSFVFKVAPCTRYAFAARKETALHSDWTLVVDRQEAVANCNVEQELKKVEGAGTAKPGVGVAR